MPVGNQTWAPFSDTTHLCPSWGFFYYRGSRAEPKFSMNIWIQQANTVGLTDGISQRHSIVLDAEAGGKCQQSPYLKLSFRSQKHFSVRH